jgi:hypothetical protein
MRTNTGNRNNDRNLAEILSWWLMLAIFAAAALILGARRGNAQQAGPLPAATPSDAPIPSPRASAPALIGGKPNFSGTWTLNKDESDDPRQAMQEAGAGGNRGGGSGSGGPRIGVGGGGGGMGGGGGWGGRGGGGGNGGGGGHRSGQNGGGENATNDLSQLTIAQTPTSATITGDSGRVLAQYSADATSQAGPSMKNSTPGASNTSPASTPTSSQPSAGSGSAAPSGDSGSTSENASATSAAQWQGSQLVAVTPGRRQGTTTRTYELSPDGKQLYVTTKIDNPRFKSPVTFRLVYDPAQASE